MKKLEILAIGAIVVVIIIVGYLVVSGISDMIHAEGVITDKFILPNVGGYPMYYFVIADEDGFEKDILVSEDTYYNYDIGKYYPQ